MVAIVKIAGQQFKITTGQTLFIPKINAVIGEKVTFSDILFVDNNGSLTFNNASNLTVTAEVLADKIQGDKVIAFKMKRRKGFRKKHGHRTHFTQIKIESIQ